jgi:uroporphyrinogen-III synthase
MSVKKSPVKKKLKKAVKKSGNSKSNVVVKKKSPLKKMVKAISAIISKKITKKEVAQPQKPNKEQKVITNSESREPINKAQSIKRVRKSSKKQIVLTPPPPPIEVSNHPKTRVRHILVSQPQPQENEKNPYLDLARKHNIQVTFRQFIKVVGLTAQEFRAQRIDILEHGAVILTSKMAVDHYFRICNEMRVTVPETMKYFCINEQTAYYLQKYIQYRKRKIFFGHGTILDLVDVIRKNKAEKFLLPSSDVHKEKIVDFLEEVKITFTKATFYKSVCADVSDLKTLDPYDILVFFTPVGIKALKQNFPNFKQGNTRIAAFGHSSAMTVLNLGYRLDIFAPNPQNPSMSGALDTYIKEANKR